MRTPHKKIDPVMAQQCKSCIFREDGNALPLEPGRLDAIRSYLVTAKSHYCHTPQLEGSKKRIICRGARNFQLEIFHRLGVIEAPTDEAWLKKCHEMGIGK